MVAALDLRRKILQNPVAGEQREFNAIGYPSGKYPSYSHTEFKHWLHVLIVKR